MLTACLIYATVAVLVSVIGGLYYYGRVWTAAYYAPKLWWWSGILAISAGVVMPLAGLVFPERSEVFFLPAVITIAVTYMWSWRGPFISRRGVLELRGGFISRWESWHPLITDSLEVKLFPPDFFGDGIRHSSPRYKAVTLEFEFNENAFHEMFFTSAALPSGLPWKAGEEIDYRKWLEPKIKKGIALVWPDYENEFLAEGKDDSARSQILGFMVGGVLDQAADNEDQRRWLRDISCVTCKASPRVVVDLAAPGEKPPREIDVRITSQDLPGLQLVSNVS